MAATELRSEAPSLVVSPRISFSHDLSQHDVVPIEPHLYRLNSTGIDFNFSKIHENLDDETSSADELFSGGKLLPSQIKTKPIVITTSPNQTEQSEMNPESSKTEEDSKASEEKQGKTTSFWPFKRSLSGGGGYGRVFCPPLPLLSRSHSTGSTPTAVRYSKMEAFSKPPSSSASSSLRTASKENWQRKLFSTASASKPQGNTFCKPPLKKKGYVGYGSGVRVNPVLNVPSANLFGLGSIFSNAKDKNKKK